MTELLVKFQEMFEITNDKKDYVLSSVMIEWLNTNGFTRKRHITYGRIIPINITKLGIDINKYVTLNKYENVESVPKKIDGKTKQVWTGIKKRVVS